MNKKLFVIPLILCLIFLSTFQSFAAVQNDNTPIKYIGLGDSIAFGMSAGDFPYEDSYFSLYSEYLYGDGDINLGVPGDTSSQLLDKLTFNDTQSIAIQNIVGNADVITISIGGNNYLSPIIFGIYAAYPSASSDLNVDGHIDLLDLAIAINSGGETNWDCFVAGLTASAMMTELDGNDYYSSLAYVLFLGAQQFETDWPEIIARIKLLNPDAQIEVLNLYNPVNELESPQLYAVIDALVNRMNKTINTEKLRNEYKVLNVYAKFAESEEAVDFSVLWDQLNPDPHPTTEGHELIFNELVKSKVPKIK